MIRILLLRHGATDLMGRVLYGRMPGVHLSDTGRRQAELLGETINSRYQLLEIVSSPLERAVETAEIVRSATGVPLTIDNDWMELDYGEWMGMSFDQIRQLESWHHYNCSRSTGVPPGGESMMQVQSRVWKALDRILSRSKDCEDATVAVVSHGDVIRGLLVLLLGIPLDNIHRFDVLPASLSEVSFDGHYSRVLCINQNFYEKVSTA